MDDTDAYLVLLDVCSLAASRRGICWFLLYEAADEALDELLRKSDPTPRENLADAADDYDRLP